MPPDVDVWIAPPRLGVPVSLIVDDSAPCINPLYYFRLQVDQSGYECREQRIPFAFLERFAAVCQERGIRGKFSVLPYPAGFGSILDGWDGCDRTELQRWLDLVRTAIAPACDITPEMLTHTMALDVATGRMLDQPEHDWLSGRSVAELTEYFSAALGILREAGFAPTGLTQPCYFHGARADYARATLDAMRATGGPPVTFFFADGVFDGPPVPPPAVVLLDRERGEAVVDIPAYVDDYCWFTQQPRGVNAREVVDRYLTEDGTSGRLAELAASGAWVTFVCHWQSLYSDGTTEGLRALDEVAARLNRVYGDRLIWLTLSEITRYRAASESCHIDVRQEDGGWLITLDAAFDCPDFTLSMRLPNNDSGLIRGMEWIGADGERRVLAQDEATSRLLSAGTWRPANGDLSVCVDLRRGRQAIQLEHAGLERIAQT